MLAHHVHGAWVVDYDDVALIHHVVDFVLWDWWQAKFLAPLQPLLELCGGHVSDGFLRCAGGLGRAGTACPRGR